MIDLDLEMANSAVEKRDLEDKKSSYVWRSPSCFSKPVKLI